MVKEFGNSTEDSIEGGLGRYESVSPSNAMLEMIVVTMVVTRRIPRRILKTSQMGLKPKRKV